MFNTNNFNKIVDIIRKYNLDYTLYPPATDLEISQLEGQLNFYLPEDFKEFLKFSNGIYLLYDQIFGIYNKTDSNDLFTNYKQETEESGNPIPKNYCPVLNNGRGDVECIILYETKEVNLISPVIFWQHDLDNNLESPRIIANSFYEYIDELINEDLSNL